MTDTPDFTLRFEERADYLYAYVTGPRDGLVLSMNFWSQIHSKVVGPGSRAVIVEEDFPNQVSIMDMSTLIESLTTMFRHKIKISHVDRQFLDMQEMDNGIAQQDRCTRRVPAARDPQRYVLQD